jgi:hypothetical protein
MAKQNDAGTKAEVAVRDFFAERRYWSFLIPKSRDGQPFDLIARKDSKNYKDIWFIDAKHLEENKVSFAFSRIEPNQISSMEYAKYFCGIDDQMGFVVMWERDENLYYFSFDDFLRISEEGRKSIKIEEMQNFSELIRSNLNVHKNIE